MQIKQMFKLGWWVAGIGAALAVGAFYAPEVPVVRQFEQVLNVSSAGSIMTGMWLLIVAAVRRKAGNCPVCTPTPTESDKAEGRPDVLDTPRMIAGKLLSDLVELYHDRTLSPFEPTPLSRMIAELRDRYQWDEEIARRHIDERLDPIGDPRVVEVHKVKGYFAEDMWEHYVVQGKELPC